MATNRKLGRTTDIRLAMLKTQVTDLLWHEKIETTVTRAKETKAIADSLIALAVKEAGNFEEVEVKVSKAKLDEKGVGQLVKIAVEKGKSTRPNIKLGICGEHGGDPSSVEFCNSIGLDYVSCSPFRVPIARLAAAQAAIAEK